MRGAESKFRPDASLDDYAYDYQFQELMYQRDIQQERQLRAHFYILIGIGLGMSLLILVNSFVNMILTLRTRRQIRDFLRRLMD
jgi:hypothetical protein